MRPTLISLQNNQVKNLVKLRQRRQRQSQGLMLIDGVRALHLAIVNDFSIQIIYYDEERPDPGLLHLAEEYAISLQPVTSSVFQKIGYGDNPDGHLGLATSPELELRSFPEPTGIDSLYVVVEEVEKPGNLGAILRSADAAGVAGVMVCTPVTDIANPNIIRASQGTFFTVPIALTITPNARQWLHDHQVQILAATPAAERCYTDFDLSRPTAIVVGAESTGLSKAWLSEQTIRVPMAGQVDSLNVAQTATILIFEAARQRGFPKKKHHEIFS